MLLPWASSTRGVEGEGTSKLVAARERMGIMGEFFGFLWRQKLWWMIPMFAVVAVFGLLMVFAQSSALAPFIYTLF